MTSYDFSVGHANWTANAGSTPGATAAFTAGVGRLTYDRTQVVRWDGVNGFNGPNLQLNILSASVATPTHFRARMRLSAWSNTDGNSRLAFSVVDAAAPTGGFDIGVTPAGLGFTTNLYSNSNPTLTASGAIAIGSTTWFAVEIDGTNFNAYYGIGVGAAPPTAWTVLPVIALGGQFGNGQPQLPIIAIAAFQNAGGAAGTVTINIARVDVLDAGFTFTP